MTIEQEDGRKVARLYWDDLLPAVQKALFEELGHSNGNYDLQPFAEITLDDESDDPVSNNCPDQRFWDPPYPCDEYQEKGNSIREEMIKCLFRLR